MEYLPIDGLPSFVSNSLTLAYGAEAAPLREERVAAVQTLSGTGACRLFADFVSRFLPGATVYLPAPTWSNHHGIFEAAGVPKETYAYFDSSTRAFDFASTVRDLEAAPEGSVVLLHACAHNPTGADPTEAQWRELSKLFLRKRLFPFFDMAYQGFASGDFAKDAQSVAIFLADGHDLALSQSYAKNMGLYGQRVGCLSVVCASPDEAKRTLSQLKAIARATYSSPPLHGARLADAVLSDPELKAQWLGEVEQMAARIQAMRTALRANLEATPSTLPWNHVTDQIGMFCFSGLAPEQVDRLTNEYAIYMTRNGRISMAGVTSGNVERLAQAIYEVTK